MEKIVKIYTLSHPLTKEIRYVGKTVESLEERLRKHILRKDNTYKSKWIASLKKENLVPKIELLDLCSLNDWHWIEKYWISQFKCWNFKLTNICEGGRGSDGLKHSTDSKEKIGKWHKGKQWRLGAVLTNKTKNKIRLGNLNKKRNSNSINKMIITRTGMPIGVGRNHTIEHINNITNGMIKAKGKSVLQYDLNMNLIKFWKSISMASKALKIPNSNIVNVCKGNRKTAKNFIWIYN
jgi:group I intron endonuclease